MTTGDTIRAFLNAPAQNEEILADAERRPASLDFVTAAILTKSAYKGGKVAELKAALERLESMTIQETTKRILDMPIKSQDIKDTLAGIGIDNPTYLDWIAISIITRTAKSGTTNDLCALAEILRGTK